MRVKYSPDFKTQAVEKALNRTSGTGIKDIAETLGVGYSTLERWIVQARTQPFESTTDTMSNQVSFQKQPQDWSRDERTNFRVESAITGQSPHRSVREQFAHTVLR